MKLAIVLVVCAGCASSVLLWPPKRPKLDGGAYIEMVADGSIEVYVAPTDRWQRVPDAFVLAFFGNGQDAYPTVAYVAAALEGMKVELWGVNYPGFGNSKGDAKLGNIAGAARAAYRELARYANGRPIIVLGSSMGTTAALHVAAHEQVAGVVLHNPVPLKQLVLRRHGWWNLWLAAIPIALQIPDELDTIGNARRVKAPALFISSEDDGVVPMHYQERIMKAYAGPWELALVRGAGHNDQLPDWVAAKVRATLDTWVPGIARWPAS